MPVAIFVKNLKRLVPVGDLCFMANEDIPEVSQDCVPCTYNMILFQKMKKGLGLSKVSTLTPVDTSGLTVQLTNTGTHKIDSPTLKLFSMV